MGGFGFGPGGGFGGGFARPGAQAGLPFGGIPSELQERVDRLLADEREAPIAVVDWLIEETLVGIGLEAPPGAAPAPAARAAASPSGRS